MNARLSKVRVVLPILILLGATTSDAARPCSAAHLSAGAERACALRHDGLVACWGAEEFAPYSERPQGSFAQISVGPTGQACGVRAGGDVECWSWDGGWPAPVAPAGSFSQISVGWQHVCGVRTDAAITCTTTLPDATELAAPEGAFLDVVVGNDFACGRRNDRTAECWGDDDAGQSEPGAGTFVQLAASFDFACGLRDDGSIACWGAYAGEVFEPFPPGQYVQFSLSNGFAAWGAAVTQDGSLAWWNNDLSFDTGTPILEVATGGGGACVLRNNAAVDCLGAFGSVDAGLGSRHVSGTFTQISAGGDPLSRPLSCGLQSGAKVVCWGNDQLGQIDAPAGAFTQVSAGTYSACAVGADGHPQCWGDPRLAALAPEQTFTQLAVATAHACGVRDDRTVQCWGTSESGATDVPAGNYAQVAVGMDHSCALNDDGDAVCWGAAGLSEGSDPPAGPFVEIVAAGTFETASTPFTSLSCGLRPDGRVACWGNDELGQLDVPAGSFVQVAAGAGHACALDGNDRVVCWGDDLAGETHPPGGEFAQVAVGYAHGCGLRADNSVECWGDDETLSLCTTSLQCGNGVTDDAEDCDDGDVTFTLGDYCSAECTRVRCGVPTNRDSTMPTARDALFVLRAAVGQVPCDARVCDVNRSDAVTATDALLTLRKSVGIAVRLSCPA